MSLVTILSAIKVMIFIGIIIAQFSIYAIVTLGCLFLSVKLFKAKETKYSNIKAALLFMISVIMIISFIIYFKQH